MEEVSLLSPNNLLEYCKYLNGYILSSLYIVMYIHFITNAILEVRHCSGIEEGNINFARRVCGPKDI